MSKKHLRGAIGLRKRQFAGKLQKCLGSAEYEEKANLDQIAIKSNEASSWKACDGHLQLFKKSGSATTSDSDAPKRIKLH